MQIKISKAVKLFFPNPKFELVFYEAVANSIDGHATDIVVENFIDSTKGSTSIELKITDNGIGFVDKNFSKFSKLLEVETEDHKGVGRLVFLNYFDNIHISSVFCGKKREFLFNKDFSGDSNLKESGGEPNGTVLHFKDYNKGRLKSYDAICPENLRTSIIRHFFPVLYEKKLKEENLRIIFKQTVSDTDTSMSEEEIENFDVSSLDELFKVECPASGLDLLSDLEILYSIKKVNGRTSIITSICSDGRTIPLKLLNKSQLPNGYELIFVVYSDFFTGKSDSSRQSLTLTDYESKTLTSILVEKLSKILSDNIPEVKSHNQEAVREFSERYPHLKGYFKGDSVGLIERNRVIEDAQKKFFLAQREILEADELDQEKYEKSLEVSSRLLTEYILYRTLIVNRLKEIDESQSEASIHNTIIPMKKILKGSELKEQIFFNNAWLIDDKFMNFRSVLSDCDLKSLARELEIEDEEFESGKRPDITIIFSSDVETSEKVDVVIVELKKMGLPLAKREEVVSQLKQRARKLVLHYPNKIQRMWFYGIVDFSEEFKVSLMEDKFIELFSSGNLFYKEHSIIPDAKNLSFNIPVGLFVLDFNAFIHDAESRNKTFLEILKSGFEDFC